MVALRSLLIFWACALGSDALFSKNHEAGSPPFCVGANNTAVVCFEPVTKALKIVSKGQNLTTAIVAGAYVGSDAKLYSFAPDLLRMEWASTQTRLEIALNHSLSDENATVIEVRWRSWTMETLLDSISLPYPDVHWYGGCELKSMKWPLENNELALAPYLPGDILSGATAPTYGGIMERYWLNSERVAITVGAHIPLWLSFNFNGSRIMELMSQYRNSSYESFRRSAFLELSYRIWIGTSSMKNLHLSVINKELGKPTAIPDERMLRVPVWSTWPIWKDKIDQPKTVQFAKDIARFGFSNSQIEIDETWTSHYGDFNFDKVKFPDPVGMVKSLKQLGFRTTVWVPPFANVDSEAFKENPNNCSLWICNTTGQPVIVHWWNGAGVLMDPTSVVARNWFAGRLKELQAATGIDSFKFDSGEVLYLPKSFNLSSAEGPLDFTTAYAEFASTFGDMIEVRVGARNQELPIFTRIMDKDTTWGYDNGLRAMLTSTLTTSLLGYPFVLPDMVAGNAYGGQYPDPDLYLRWLAATIFLPSVQMSIPPWNFNPTLVDASRQLLSIRDSIADEIVALAKVARDTGAPIVRPLWWMEETPKALIVDDEFLLGDDILVAPILDKGRNYRITYLPSGTWKSMMSGYAYKGPASILEFPDYNNLCWYRKLSA